MSSWWGNVASPPTTSNADRKAPLGSFSGEEEGGPGESRSAAFMSFTEITKDSAVPLHREVANRRQFLKICHQRSGRGQDLGQPVKRLLGDSPSPTPSPLAAAAAAANALNASTAGDAVGKMAQQVSEGRQHVSEERQHVSEGRQHVSEGRQHVSEFFRSTDEDDGFHRHVLHLRDLHCLKPGTEPIIHVRLDAIVVNLPPIQGVITHKAAYFLKLDSDWTKEGTEAMLDHLSEKRKTSDEARRRDGRGHDTQESSLAALVLESALASVESTFASRTLKAAEEADNLLKSFRKQISQDVLHKLKVFKRKVAQMEELAKGLHQAVHETLQETGELKQLLAAFSVGGDGEEESGREGSSAELLLDRALTRLEARLLEVGSIIDEVDRTEDMLRVQLSNSRNRILNVGVGFGVLAMWITAAQVVTGVVGMNLRSSLLTRDMGEQVRGQQEPGTTYVQVGVGSGVGSMICTLLTIAFLKRRKWM